MTAAKDPSAWMAWIRSRVGKNHGYGQCRRLAKAMVVAFPELELRYGFFYSAAWGRREHWWCRDRITHQIVDPTGLQHPDGALFAAPDDPRWEDLTDLPLDKLRRRVPTGRCMGCGEDIYEGGTVCGDACQQAVLADLGDR